ncbi:MAG: polysaccharide deacetylase family protein [Dethiobacter sp.]|jgi:probable sporulation protein (polysaccharide deacetylase family)|nr:polysaccharide deacetylase family protein [Dethiobacter sp.]
MRKPEGFGYRWTRPVLVLFLIGTLILLLFYIDEPLRRHFGGVKPGVTLLNVPLEGLFRFEVAAIVAELARAEGRKPLNAQLDEEREAIVPELNGLEIDQEATADLVFNASREVALKPVYREIYPDLRWEHYPSRPAYRGNSRKQAVALMINVAWGEEYLPDMLSVLEKEESLGTFFLTGKWAEKNEGLVQSIAHGGHELANHGYSDAEVFPELDGWAMAQSIRRTNEIIFETTGSYPLYFTPHRGEKNNLTLELVSRHGMRTVLWSLDTVDWKKPGVQAMKNKIMNHVEPGMIILMHPTADTVTLLEEIIPMLREQNLKIVTIRELLCPSWPIYQIAKGNVQ